MKSVAITEAEIGGVCTGIGLLLQAYEVSIYKSAATAVSALYTFATLCLSVPCQSVSSSIR